jgi:hypothetical protein
VRRLERLLRYDISQPCAVLADRDGMLQDVHARRLAPMRSGRSWVSSLLSGSLRPLSRSAPTLSGQRYRSCTCLTSIEPKQRPTVRAIEPRRGLRSASFR